MIDIRHQFLIFALINNRDNLIVVSLYYKRQWLINRCAAVQLMNNKLSQRLFLLCNNADSALDIVVKNKMIQHNAVEISAENTQNYSLLS